MDIVENPEYICKCTNCDSFLYDENPQVGATKHYPPSFGVEILPMELLNKDGDSFWGCGNCQTDAHLIDLDENDDK
jgi:hypothetical protein